MRPLLSPTTWRVLAVAAFASLPAAPAGALLIVQAVVTPTGGAFDYQLTIDNQLADDVAIVSLVDAPLADPLLPASLTAPGGYLASYDSGLGIVDFLEDTSPFLAGVAVSGFSFTALSAPGPARFAAFEALTVLGGLVTGTVQVTIVPEPGTLLLLWVGLAALGRRRMVAAGGALALVSLLLSPTAARASSHSDAPLIKQDPQANLTDVYAFVSTKFDDPSQRVLTVLASVRPFSEPGDGAIYERFADDARYSIHITNPATGATVDRYDFRFSSVTAGLKNPDTILSYGLGSELGPILSIGDGRQNYTQIYGVSRNDTSLGSGLPVAPPNVGLRTTPAYNDSTTGKAISGAILPSELDALTAQAVRSLPSGVVVFAGPREDGFYADTPGFFDLLDPRLVADRDGNPNTGGLGQDGGGSDGFRGFNVLSYGIQIPVTALTPAAYVDPLSGAPATGVGVYASVSRPRIRLLTSGGPPVSSGAFVQVNRLGNPLFNEVLVALRDKDRYNRASPAGDAQFAGYALNPEPARLINLVLFGDAEGDSPLPVSGRTDLVAIFIPDVLRVDTTTPPVQLPGQAAFSRLGVLGGDVTTSSGGQTRSGGWPNGRRIGDDVVDIALTALSRFTVDIGDNVNANDQLYHRVFPYLGTPHAGPTADQGGAP